MFKRKKLATAIGVAIAAIATTGMLATDVAYAADEGVLEEIVVTGSRIRRTDLIGDNPVTILDRSYLTNMGNLSIGDILQDIPNSAGGATNTGVNNGGAGAVRFSLRGLGSPRTLVLLNGRRVVPSGLGVDISVDLNNIPVSMIERVEVLKDGASAIYGSDAIAGVVNIITRKNFEGVDFNAYTGQTSESDGENDAVDLTMGISGDKGNAVVSAYYVNQKPIWAGDRKYSEVEIWFHPYWDPTGQDTGGSSAVPWGNYNTADGRVTRGSEFGDFRAYSGATDSYNYAPANYTQTPNERWGVSFFADYDMGNYGALGDIRLSTEAFYTQRRSQRLIAPEPLAPLVFFGVPAPISTDNYYNQMFGPKDANGDPYTIDDWRRRMIETGGRDQHHKAQTYQVTAAITGEIGDWLWEVNALYGENTGSVIDTGYFHLGRVGEAVGPTFFDSNGDLKCGTSEADEIAGCVPLNPFGQPGTDSQITQDMLQYISGNYVTLTEGGNTLKSAAFNVTGDVFELPAGPVGLAAGIEKRWTSGFSQPDSLALLGISTAGSALATEGSYSVEEAYLELAIPVIAERLDVSLAARYSDYSTYGSTTTTKVGFRLQVIDGLVLRGTLSEAFRAPSVQELYLGQQDTFPQVADPCAADPTPTCVADGVPAAGYDNSGIIQLRSIVGGNIQLQPEEADIYTVGFVWQPTFLDGASLTVDYWDVDISDPISTNGPQVILDDCWSTGLNCDLIDRMPAGSAIPGNVTFIRDLNANVGQTEAAGVDIAVQYDWPETSFGLFTFNLDAAHYLTYDKTLSNGVVVDHVGRLEDNQDGNFPDWKLNFRTRWTYNNWDAQYTMRWIDEVAETLTNWFHVDPVTFEATNEQHTIDSMTTHDIQVSYTITDYNTRLILGVDNIADEQPPYSGSAFNDNTDVRTYPTMGRYMYARVNVTF